MRITLAAALFTVSVPPALAAEVDPPSVIFDTDMGSDCDDAGGLAVLHALADAGELKILGVVFSSGKNRYGVGTCDAINLPGTPETNPVREAYRLWNKGTAITKGRSSWDQVAVLFVARPELFTLERTGRVERLADGKVIWNPRVDRPNHFLVTPRLANDRMAEIIERLMARRPKSHGRSAPSQ